MRRKRATLNRWCRFHIGGMDEDVMSLIASGYEVDEDNAKQLESWLTAGKWSIEEATLLFLEINPDTAFGECFATFSGSGSIQYEYFDDDDPGSRILTGRNCDGEEVYLTSEQETMLHKKRRMCKEIKRKMNLHESAEPREWIDLALKKGITIPWFDWAIKRGLIPTQVTERTPLSCFDKASPTYPHTLTLDLQADAGITTAVSDASVVSVSEIAATDAQAAPVDSSSITSSQVAQLFDGLPYTAKNWPKRLSDTKWLIHAKIGAGQVGGISAQWCPLLLAHQIHAREEEHLKQKTLDALSRRFNKFLPLQPWRDAWNDHYAMFTNANND